MNHFMNHFIKKCKECDVVINQCRCADPRKEVIYTLCKKCKKIKEEDQEHGKDRTK